MNELTSPAPSAASNVGRIIGDVAVAAASAFIPVGTLQDIVKLAATYGPEAAMGIIALFKKKEVTIEDVEAAFADLKPLEFYQIPLTVPTAPEAPKPPTVTVG